jgi:hypothetical protein
MKPNDAAGPQDPPTPDSAEWFGRAPAGAPPTPPPTVHRPVDAFGRLRETGDELAAAKKRLARTEAEAAARKAAPVALPKEAQDRIVELQQRLDKVPPDDHPAIGVLLGEILETRVGAERAVREERASAADREVEDARNAVAAALLARDEARVPTLLGGWCTAAERVQKAVEALRAAMRDVEAMEQEVQAFVQSGACPESSKGGLRNLHHAVRRQLAQTLHAAGVIWGPDAQSGVAIVDLGAFARAQANHLLAALTLARGAR